MIGDRPIRWPDSSFGQGSQYVSIRYSERLDEAGINPSVGSTGDAYDNALAETINRLYKTEVIYKRGPWKTKAAVELATLEWVSWFNHQRLLESIGDIPPAEAEQRYYQQLAVQAAEPALSSLDVRSYATAKAPQHRKRGQDYPDGGYGGS